MFKDDEHIKICCIRALFLLAVTFLLIAFSRVSYAGSITTFFDRADFDAAVGNTTVEDFLDGVHFPITSGVLNEFTNEAGIQPGDIQSGVTYSTPVGKAISLTSIPAVISSAGSLIAYDQPAIDR